MVLINHSLETGEVTRPSRVVPGLLGEACRRDEPQGGDGSLQHGGEEGASGGPVGQRGGPSTGEHDTSLVRKGRGTAQILFTPALFSESTRVPESKCSGWASVALRKL